MAIINPDHLCIYCMREKPDSGICPYCGFDEAQYEPSPHHLPPRSILGGKCLVGRVLGEGGFGITYLGWDLNLDLKLAIKEYYPAGFVTRTGTTTNTVTPYRGEKTEFFSTGRARFINEAKTLAKFYTLPGIVSVRDFFLENGTAYIVMEFVEGETLKQRLARVGGKMEASEVFALVHPLLRSLAEMHAAGLIHRDISPDNIMITPEGNVKLIDFGAARDYLDSGNRSLSVMLKPGFAPEEQYFARGQQGPWTDIYALCATIYRAITGVTPPESVERLRNDELKAPSALGVRISPAEEAALLKGMAVSQEERWQTIPELNAALYAGGGNPVDSAQPATLKKASPETADSMAPDAPKQAPGGNAALDQEEAAPNNQEKVHKNPFRKSKGFMNVAYAALAVFVVVVVALAINGIVIHQKTQRIESFLEDRNFDMAIALIEAIDTDTTAYDNALYQAAQELLDAGEFEKAAIAKGKIVNTDKQDIISLEDQIAYQKAKDFVSKGDYLSAEKTLATIEDTDRFDIVSVSEDILAFQIESSFSKYNSSDAVAGIMQLQQTNKSRASTLISQHISEIYNYAVTQYQQSHVSESAKVFGLLSSDYQRTSDYLVLIEAHRLISNDSNRVRIHYSSTKQSIAPALIKLAGFEDAGEMLLNDQEFAKAFLCGYWTGGGYYFNMKEDGHITYNVPYFEFGNYYRIEDGEVLLFPKDDNSNTKMLYKLTVISENCIEIFAAKNSRTYTLYRN